MKNRKWLIVLGIGLLVGFVIKSNNIPLNVIVKSLSAPDDLIRIHIMLDKGMQGDEQSIFIEDARTLRDIMSILNDIRVSYCGKYSTIPYCKYPGDWIIRVAFDNGKEVLFITKNSELYTLKSKYVSYDQDTKALYEYLLTLFE